MKKIISVILVCVMVAMLLPVAVFADDVVEIATAEDFAKIADNLGGSYKLTADIKLTTPLSYREEDKKFTGTFDGNGKTIEIEFNDTNAARMGVFCSVEGCTIKNLNVVGTLASNGNSTAALIGTAVGDNATVTIENVTTDVDFTAANSINGQAGIIGCVENNGTVNLINCVNKGDINGEVVGGLIGAVVHSAKINLTNCVNEGTIVSLNQYADYRGAGGFIGKVQQNGASVTITGCENKGEISAKYIVANAYVGHNNANTYNVTDTTNTGKIISGGLELPAETAVTRDQGIWGSAGFGYNFDEGKLSGSPEFHALPETTGFTAYLSGELATDKVTLEVVEGGNRKLNITVDTSASTAIDGFASITIIFSNGKYATFGAPAPGAADIGVVKDSAETLSKYDAAGVNKETISAETPFLKDGQAEPHGSEANLFDNATGKYEGWKTFGKSTIVSFEATEAVKLGYYALGTGGDDMNFPSRQPCEWKLWGSTDGEEYVVIDYVENYDLPNINNKLVAFEAETDVAYKYFKLEIIKITEELTNTTGTYGYAQLGEIVLYKACEHTYGEPVVVDPTCTKDGSSTVTCTNCGNEVVTVIESEGHNYVDGVCTGCGKAESTTPPAETGDVTFVLMIVSIIAMISTAVVVTKRRYQN